MSNPIQPGLFNLSEVAQPPEPGPAQVPLDGTVTWTRITKKTVECVDCWREQAADHEARRPVHRRDRARVKMTSGSDEVELCARHAWRRGWEGRS